MINYSQILILILAFTRVSAFIFLIPFLSGGRIPTVTKIVISTSIAYAAVSFFHLHGTYSTWSFMGALIVQFLIGATLGFSVNLLITSVEIAGGILDIDLGFSAASILNPVTNQTSSTISNFYYFLFTLVFLMVGGVRDLIASVVYSFQFQTTGAFVFHGSFIQAFLALVAYMMVAAVQIALPLIVTMFMVNFILLIIAKTSQTINIMGIAFGIKILVGIVVIILLLPYLANLFSQMEVVIMEKLLVLIKTMLG